MDREELTLESINARLLELEAYVKNMIGIWSSNSEPEQWNTDIVLIVREDAEEG